MGLVRMRLLVVVVLGLLAILATITLLPPGRTGVAQRLEPVLSAAACTPPITPTATPHWTPGAKEAGYYFVAPPLTPTPTP